MTLPRYQLVSKIGFSTPFLVILSAVVYQVVLGAQESLVYVMFGVYAALAMIGVIACLYGSSGGLVTGDRGALIRSSIGLALNILMLLYAFHGFSVWQEMTE